MTKQVINVGTTANDKKGDSLRLSFQKVNANFTELYTALGLAADVNLNLGAFEFTGSTITTTDSSSIVIDQATTITSNLTVGGDIVPGGNLTSTLGSPTNKFHSIYVGTGSVYLGDAKLSLEGGKLSSSVGFDLSSASNIGSALPSQDGHADQYLKTDGAGTLSWSEAGASVVTSDTAPSSPAEGDLWYDTVSGRTYIQYDNNWVDASPEDGTGDPDRLINGVHSVRLETTGTLTLADGLTIADSVIGYNSSNTISEEIPGGTISETTTVESQIEITDTNIVIAKRIIQVVNDGVTTSEDSAGSTLEVSDTGAFVKHYVEPDGPNNSAYFQVRADNDGAILEGVEQNVSNTNFGRVAATQGLVVISTSIDGLDHEWSFYNGILTLPGSNSYLESTDINLKVGSQGTVTIRSNAESNLTDREWVFDRSGTLNTPLMLPLTFNPILDSEHMTRGAGLTDAPWEFQVEFQVNPDGTVQTAINNPTWPSNPGYINGDEFVYVEADHGIPGYTFSLILNNIVEGEGWTANLAVAETPEYPSTVATLGAIKLTANDQSFVFGTDGHLVLPDGARIKSTSSFNGQLEIELDGIEPQNWKFTTEQGPGTLEYPDGAFTTGSQTFSAIDHNLVLGVRHRPTVLADCAIAVGDEFVADIEFNDDITVVQVGWTVNVDGTDYTVTSIDPAPPANQYRITAEGATFLQGTTYTFTDSDSVTNEWMINSDTATLVAPGGAILSSETAIVGEGDSYRDFSIELATPDGLNEYRWTFDNTAGALTIPGGIASSADMTFTAGSSSITLDTAGQLVTESAIKWQEGGQERAAIAYNPFTDSFVIGTNTGGITKAWKFGDNGNLTFPDDTVQTTAFTVDPILETLTVSKGSTGYEYQLFVNDINGRLLFRNYNNRQGVAGYDYSSYTSGIVVDTTTDGYTVVSGEHSGSSNSTSFTFDFRALANGVSAERKGVLRFDSGVDNGPSLSNAVSMKFLPTANAESNSTYYEFATTGLRFLDATVQTTAYVKTTGTWTVTPGTANYSFEVPINGVYQLWVRANIPNGIVSYTATAAVTNSNVPVLGTQYAWNYTAAGDPILFTALPTQFVGAEGTISTANPSVGSTTNIFVFGLANSTSEDITVAYGYTKIS